MPNISASIDLKKVDQSICIKGEKGTYANISVIPNKNGEDQYGNTHMIVQTVPKSLRKSEDQRGPIIGNGKEWGASNQSAGSGGSHSDDAEDDIPF